MLRFVLNVYKVVTFVLINIFRCGKKYVVGIGEYNMMVELIEGFVVNFELSLNVNLIVGTTFLINGHSLNYIKH